ncbi:hypothetical protein BSKO_12037 [Bryopsis sp. KO-2023]|nr:hypothetical protein BSKO_12037 [Bryopsis sp. KO-2023]
MTFPSKHRESEALHVCPARTRRLQKLCAKNNLDGILLVAGMDGKHNVGSHQILSFIFQGHCAWDPMDALPLPRYLEDLVLLVTPTDLRLWTPGEHVETIFQHFGELQRVLRIFRTVQGDEENDDVIEECKVGAFVQMLAGVKTIGLGFHGHGSVVHGVEQWPLIQAYGLEGVGKSGFFTMNFEVKNISHELRDLYKVWDMGSMHQLLSTSVPKLAQHWEEMIQTIDIRPTKARPKLRHKDVGEPLHSYVEHVDVRSENKAKQRWMPWLAFGRNSDTEKESPSNQLTSDCLIVDDPSSTHFVCEANDPHSGVSIARSYFLSLGGLQSQVLPDCDFPDPVRETSNTMENDCKNLMLLYGLLFDTSRRLGRKLASQGFEAGPNREKEAEIIGVAKAGFAAELENLKMTLCKEDMALDIQLNHLCMEPESICVFVVRLSVPSIRTRGDIGPESSRSLGGLVHADTFMQVEGMDGKWRQVNLTEGTPAFRAFAIHPDEASIISQAQSTLRGALGMIRPSTANSGGSAGGGVPVKLTHLGERILGQPIGIGRESCVMYTGSTIRPVLQGSIHFFSEGLIFVCPDTAPFILDFAAQVQSVTLQDMHDPSTSKSYPDIGQVVVFQGRTACCGLAPVSHVCRDSILAVPLESMSASCRRHFLRNVIPAWKRFCVDHEIQFESLESALPVFSQELYPPHWAALQSQKKYCNFWVDDEIDRALSTAQAIQDGRLWGDSFTETASKTSNRVEEGTPITVISGPPCSNQNRIAEAMLRTHAGEPAVWIPVNVRDCPDLRDENTLEELHDVLRIASSKAKSDEAACRKQQILLVLPSTALPSSIAHAIESTRCVQQGACFLATMITCVDVDTWLGARWEGLLNVVSQADPAYVSHIVLLGKNTTEVQRILRLRNPLAQTICCSNDFSADVPLSLSHFVPRTSDLSSWKAARTLHQTKLLVEPERWWGSFDRLCIKFRGRIDIKKLREEIAFIGIARDPEKDLHPPPYRFDDPDSLSQSESTVFGVSGRLSQKCIRTGACQTYIVEGSRSVGLECHEVCTTFPLLEASCVGGVHDLDCDGGDLVFWGKGVGSMGNGLQGMIEKCQFTMPPLREIRDASSVTKAETAAIQEAHKHDPLPDGWHFSQGMYIDAFGDRQRLHPDLEKHVQSFIDKENEAAKKSNQELIEEYSRCSIFEVIV